MVKLSVYFGKSNNSLDAYNIFFLVTHQDFAFLGNKTVPPKKDVETYLKKFISLLDHVIKSGFCLLSDNSKLTKNYNDVNMIWVHMTTSGVQTLKSIRLCNSFIRRHFAEELNLAIVRFPFCISKNDSPRQYWRQCIIIELEWEKFCDCTCSFRWEQPSRGHIVT